MCAAFGKTKQAYYKQLKSVELKSITNEIMLGLIEKKEHYGNVEAVEICTKV